MLRHIFFFKLQDNIYFLKQKDFLKYASVLVVCIKTFLFENFLKKTMYYFCVFILFFIIIFPIFIFIFFYIIFSCGWAACQPTLHRAWAASPACLGLGRQPREAGPGPPAQPI